MPENTKQKKKKVTKARLRFRRFCAVMILLLIVWWFNNYTLKTVKVTVTSDKVTSPVRIAVISDQHATHLGIGNGRIVRRIKKADPDIVFMLGDMYTSGSSESVMEIPVKLAGRLTDEGYPVYFVSGEHDTDSSYLEALSGAGAEVMNYRESSVMVNGNILQIIGIDDAFYPDGFDLEEHFRLNEECFSILMAHIPNYPEFSKFGADLTLCADTHGGMIQLPLGLGAAYDALTGEWFPEIGTKRLVFDKGLFKYKGGAMFITSGIGVYPAPVRFNNRPEIAVIDIEPEKKGG